MICYCCYVWFYVVVVVIVTLLIWLVVVICRCCCLLTLLTVGCFVVDSTVVVIYVDWVQLRWLLRLVVVYRCVRVPLLLFTRYVVPVVALLHYVVGRDVRYCWLLLFVVTLLIYVWLVDCCYRCGCYCWRCWCWFGPPPHICCLIVVEFRLVDLLFVIYYCCYIPHPFDCCCSVVCWCYCDCCYVVDLLRWLLLLIVIYCWICYHCCCWLR